MLPLSNVAASLSRMCRSYLSMESIMNILSYGFYRSRITSREKGYVIKLDDDRICMHGTFPFKKNRFKIILVLWSLSRWMAM
jgi:hypothetical protein